MADIDGILRPWWDQIVSELGELTLFDVHTHIGANDPDGYRQSPEQLRAALASVGARGAVFAMHEPDGYSRANDAVLAAAAESDGRLVAFCRVAPRDDAVGEARRCLDAGARGIKLHPRSDRFTLSEPVVRDLVALAHDRQVPIIIHAGRGIPALGRDTVRLSGDFRRARLILAHAAISDLAWIWRVLPEHPNVLVDTAWWNPADLIALMALVPPGQVVWGSDSPYGVPLASATMTMRCALQAGLTLPALRSIAGEQVERLMAGEDPLDVGLPPGAARALDPLLERLVTHLVATFGRVFARADVGESLALAQLSCAVGEEGPHADVFAAVLELLEHFEANFQPAPDGRPLGPGARFLVAALVVARTPDVPIPALADAPAPTRDEVQA